MLLFTRATLSPARSSSSTRRNSAVVFPLNMGPTINSIPAGTEAPCLARVAASCTRRLSTLRGAAGGPRARPGRRRNAPTGLAYGGLADAKYRHGAHALQNANRGVETATQLIFRRRSLELAWALECCQPGSQSKKRPTLQCDDNLLSKVRC